MDVEHVQPHLFPIETATFALITKSTTDNFDTKLIFIFMRNKKIFAIDCGNLNSLVREYAQPESNQKWLKQINTRTMISNGSEGG